MVHVMNVNMRRSIRKRLNLNVDIYSFDEYLGLHKTRDMNLSLIHISEPTRL